MSKSEILHSEIQNPGELAKLAAKTLTGIEQTSMLIRM